MGVINKIFTIYFILFSLTSFAQDVKDLKEIKNESNYNIKPLSKPEINFIYGYYQQDGNHSATKGGDGTQALNDNTPSIQVYIPFKKNHSVTANFGVDIITSASTDDIDYEKSSASYIDRRFYGKIHYDYESKNNQNKYGISISGSTEYDYNSIGGGVSFLRKTKDNRSQYSIQFYTFFDTWYQRDRKGLVYPFELRTDKELITDPHRNSYALSFSYSSIINRRMNFSVFTDLGIQEGLNSTPFHLIVFSDGSKNIEKLPTFRVKIPIGARFNYFFTQKLILKLYLREYWDNFNIFSTTFSLELPYKISKTFELSPKYRGTYQIGSPYFNAIGLNNINSEFYTSDYDLSTFYASQYSLGLRIAPPVGILNLKIFTLQSFDLVGGYYIRSDNLTAFFISTGLTVKF